MPSLVRFAHEILSEDRYGYAAVARVGERVGALNDAQLVGMVKHLSGSRSRARSELWRKANERVLEAVKDELDIREEEHAREEQAYYHDHREEREADELENMRRAEHDAAEKQLSKTALREAKEDVNRLLQDFRNQAKLKLMVASFKARNIRSFTWSFAAAAFLVMVVTLKIQDDNKTVAFDSNMLLVGLVGSLLILVSGCIGWRCGYAVLEEKTAVEIEDMIEGRKNDRLSAFFETDRRNRQIIELADLEDRKERRVRMAQRKKDKKILRKAERRRETQIVDAKKAQDEKRRKSFGFDSEIGDSEMSSARENDDAVTTKEADGGGGGGLQGILDAAVDAAASAAVSEAVENGEAATGPETESGGSKATPGGGGGFGGIGLAAVKQRAATVHPGGVGGTPEDPGAAEVAAEELFGGDSEVLGGIEEEGEEEGDGGGDFLRPKRKERKSALRSENTSSERNDGGGGPRKADRQERKSRVSFGSDVFDLKDLQEDAGNEDGRVEDLL